MLTKAVDDGDLYVLNGAKMWITNGTIADLAIVWAKLGGDRSRDIRGFIVEKDDIGFSAPEMKGKHSLRASIISELVFQDCRIPKDRLLPKVNGREVLFRLNNVRFKSLSVLGAAMACFHSAREYTLQRTQFNKPIASFHRYRTSWLG